MKNKMILLLVFSVLVFSCNEEPIGQQPLDSVPPGPVSNVTWVGTPGGATLSYTLPGDEDLLYVKAIFTLKDGVPSEVRASLYSDTLKVVGFGDVLPKDIQIVAVDRSKNESSPVSVTVTPLEPAVVTIGKTLQLIADFGGVHAYWKNPMRAEVSVVFLKKDNNNEYTPIETVYSSMAEGEGAKRGLDTMSGEFGIYVLDRWENKSETLFTTITPIYETMFDRLKFNAIDLPGDAPVGAGWVKPRMWDGITGEDQGFSSQGGTGIMPQSVTIDLGVVGKLSRLRIFQRMGNYSFAEGNPKVFEVWGCETLVADGGWGSWTKLMDCTSIKPSGQPSGTNTNEDLDRARMGEDFVNAPTNPKIRYIRLNVKKTWAGGDNFQICEVQVFGDNR